MSLHFVLGPAGSGKTTCLYNLVIGEAAKNPSTTYYYLVPEQFSLKTQWDLVQKSPTGGILNIDATSMARLAQSAFAKFSGRTPDFLPEIGKSMIIKKILLEKKDQLLVYGRNTRQAGFVAETKALISELLQYGVTENDLEDAIALSEKEPLLKKKLEDSLTLLEAFKEYLSKGFLTNEGLYDAFAGMLKESGILKDAVVVLDGFTGFTPSQYALLKGFMSLAKEVYVSFTIDEASMKKKLPEFDRFHMSKASVERLVELAGECGCEVSDYVFTDYNKYGCEALRQLERGLYGFGREKCPTDSAISVFAASSIEEECKIVASEVERLLRNEGYRYRDIGIIVSDMESYALTLSEELKKVRVEAFTDRKKSLYENQCAGFVGILLKLMEKGPTTDLLISYAKNSLSGIDYEEACRLENYCIGMGIKGRNFNKPFTRVFYGKERLELEDMNEVRSQIMESLSEIFGSKKGTAQSFSERLFKTLVKVGVEEKLNAFADEFREKGDKLKEKEYRKILPTIVNILEELVEFLGGDEMSATEYREIIEAGLLEAKVGLVPAGSEQIVIGDLERTRFGNIKALFLLGVNDGKLPKASGGRAILSDKDKTKLSDRGIELSPTRLKKVGKDRFYQYLALTKPTEKLFISYATKDDSGKLKESSLVSEVMKLYSDLTVKRMADLDPVQRVLQNDGGLMARLSEERVRKTEEAKTLEYIPETISEETAQKMYGEKLHGSISRLESYGNCPFKHFLTYGLSLSKRDEYAISSLDFGNVNHAALEKYGKELRSRDLKWFEISDEERRALIKKCAGEATNECKSGVFDDSEQNAYVAERVADALEITVDMLTRQLAGSDFTPYDFERKFDKDCEKYHLTGKIDRVDVCDKENLKAVKVVDYKSGVKDFEMEKLFHGLNLQLPVYLKKMISEISESEREEFLPGAMLYNVIKDPLLSVDGADLLGQDEGTAQEVREKLSGEFKTQGLINNRLEVIRSLDNSFYDAAGGLAGGVSSKKISVTTKKDGEIRSGRGLKSDEELNLIMDYAYQKMEEQVEGIKSGDVAKTPIQDSNGNRSCGYCDFHSVCGFDTRNGDKCRSIVKLEDSEYMERMKNKVENNG